MNDEHSVLQKAGQDKKIINSLRLSNKKLPEVMFAKFLRFFCQKVPQRNLKFNIALGKPLKEKLKPKTSYLCIQNPFIFELDEGAVLQDEELFMKLVARTKEFFLKVTAGDQIDLETFLGNLPSTCED